MANNIRIGIISAPELPSAIVQDIIDDLPRAFSQWLDDNVSWEVDSLVDPLTGAAENVNEILNKAIELKKEHDWTYAICLTDLPIFHKKSIVAADINMQSGIAQISLPSFGWLPMRKRIKKTMIHTTGELYHGASMDATTTTFTNDRKDQARNDFKNSNLLQKQFPISAVKRQPSSTNHHAVRFIIIPKVNGQLRLLLGMTHANEPTTAMSAFKKIIAIAFTTGAFGLIFTTIWKLSTLLSVYRLTFLMIVAIAGMVGWIIAAHQLWERSDTKSEKRLRRLYNGTTVMTLTISVIIYYTVLFVIFLMAVLVLIPPDMLDTEANLPGTPNIGNYMRLAWLSSSISTIAGAIGAGLENEALVRDITYGYRQKRRYQEIHQKE